MQLFSLCLSCRLVLLLLGSCGFSAERWRLSDTLYFPLLTLLLLFPHCAFHCPLIGTAYSVAFSLMVPCRAAIWAGWDRMGRLGLTLILWSGRIAGHACHTGATHSEPYCMYRLGCCAPNSILPGAALPMTPAQQWDGASFAYWALALGTKVSPTKSIKHKAVC